MDQSATVCFCSSLHDTGHVWTVKNCFLMLSIHTVDGHNPLQHLRRHWLLSTYRYMFNQWPGDQLLGLSFPVEVIKFLLCFTPLSIIALFFNQTIFNTSMDKNLSFTAHLVLSPPWPQESKICY